MDGVTTVPDGGVPPDVSWWRTTDGYAHAFAFLPGFGFTRSACARARWPGLATATTEPDHRCPDCELLLNGAPGEITEAWGR